MRSESPSSPLPDRPYRRPESRRIVVPIDGAAEGLRSFSAEKLEVTSAPVSEGTSLAAFASEVPAKEAPAVIRPAPRLSWRNVVLGALALVALAQGGLIAYWLSGGRANTPPETGSVTITSEPAGSPVSVDGVSRGITPFSLSLAPGQHRIEVGAGTVARTQTINVTRGGEASVHLELPRPTTFAAGMGGLNIATDSAAAQVWIDGELRGPAPLSVTDLKAGEHAVVVKGSGETVNRTVTIQEAAVASLIISMNSKSAFASGWLSISSTVPLQVIEKGTLIGSTDSPRILVPAGSHELELANAALGYRVSRTVQVAAGQTTSVPVKLPQGTLSINALPWAEVWVDGQPAGETPIGNFPVTIGNHELLFRHPELGEQRKTVAVGAAAPLRVGVDLRK